MRNWWDRMKILETTQKFSFNLTFQIKEEVVMEYLIKTVGKITYCSEKEPYA